MITQDLGVCLPERGGEGEYAAGAADARGITTLGQILHEGPRITGFELAQCLLVSAPHFVQIGGIKPTTVSKRRPHLAEVRPGHEQRITRILRNKLAKDRREVAQVHAVTVKWSRSRRPARVRTQEWDHLEALRAEKMLQPRDL